MKKKTLKKLIEKVREKRVGISPEGTRWNLTSILYYYFVIKKTGGNPRLRACARDHFRDFRSGPLPVISSDVTSGCACARDHFRGHLRTAPPQM
jgi:hypothetical protein